MCLAIELESIYVLFKNWINSRLRDDKDKIVELFTLIAKFWPWHARVETLEIEMLSLIRKATQLSADACRCIMIPVQGCKESLFNLIIKFHMIEVHKIRTGGYRIYIFQHTMNIFINCSEDASARKKFIEWDILSPLLTLTQAEIDDGDNMDLIITWLVFWERFSFYREGVLVSHLPILYKFLKFKECAWHLMSIFKNFVTNPKTFTPIMQSDELFVFLLTVFEREDKYVEVMFNCLNVILNITSNKSKKGREKIKKMGIQKKVFEFYNNRSLKKDKDIITSINSTLEILCATLTTWK